MFLIWSGRGWVIPGPGFALLLAMELSVEWLTGDNDYYQENRWPIAAVAIGLSLVLFVLVERWEPRYGSPALVDSNPSPNPIVTPAGGPIRAIKRRRASGVGRAPSSGSFIFIPLRWWRWILLAIALGLMSSEAIS